MPRLVGQRGHPTSSPLAIGYRRLAMGYGLLAIGYWLSAASEPFLQLRQSTLGYHGSSEDLTNLTELRIGWFGPTNLADPLNGDLWWAANLAVREANDSDAERGTQGAEPGTPHSSLVTRHSSLPLRLIPRWSVDPWGTGVSQLTRMVYDEQPLALIGSVDSASTHLAEQVVAKANLPLVSPISTDKSVTLAGVSWMFSCAPSDDAIAKVLVDGALTALGEGVPYAARSGVSAERRHLSTPTEGVRRSAETPLQPPGIPGAVRSLALLACTDHESRMTTREVLREFSRRGRMPDLRLDVPPSAADISQQMERLAESKPAIVLIIAGAEDSARLVLALRASTPQGHGVRQPSAALERVAADDKAPEDGRTSGRWRAGSDLSPSSPIVFGTHSMGRTRFRELAGSAAEGVRFPQLLAGNPTDARLASFAARFQAERGRAPDFAAIMTYDATRLLIEAIRRAGPNRARVREALLELSPWSGLAGTIRFDGTGQNSRTNLCLETLGTTLALNSRP